MKQFYLYPSAYILQIGLCLNIFLELVTTTVRNKILKFI